MMIHYGRYKMVKGRRQYLPLKYFIGESIRPEFWSKRANRAKEAKEFPNYAMFNQRLSHIEEIVRNLVLHFKYSGDLNAIKILRDSLDRHIKQKRPVEQICEKSLFFFIEQFISEAETTKSLSTVRQYKNTFRLLLDFSTNVQKIDFQNIDMSFYAKFKSYMNKAGYSEAYFSNQIKYVRLFMNEATERGYNASLLYKSRKFICPQVTADKIYLTTEEITRIRTAKLSTSRKLEKVRDMFVVACYTGLRFSDLVRLQPSNFNHVDKILHIRTQKTDTTVYIPLSPEALAICKKYDFSFPPINNSAFNTSIKEIGRQAGLVEKVELLISKGNSKVRDVQPKYRLITSHTARRSFATNAFLASVPNISIMQITGHSTEKAFMRYIRVSGEDNARRLLTHPYFSKK
ncbi:MAG: site-specific integrase [Prevotellaceae bacterium]|nr:site-specific integrase [Prevotellaceae bacterium]